MWWINFNRVPKLLQTRAYIIAISLMCGFCPITAFAQEFVGEWRGKLEVAAQSISVTFDIQKDTCNCFMAFMSIPEQGIRKLPVGVAIHDRTITFEIPEFDAKCCVTLLQKGCLIGSFFQRGLKIPLVMQNMESVASIRRQTPRTPFPYKLEEVSFKNEKTGAVISGTLSLPQSPAPFSAVVLVSGSGSQDRDETLCGHKPFAVIADYLTRRGYAVLRYDDRGVGSSEIGKDDGTTASLSFDCESAVHFLQNRNDISHIGIAGHSEGGTIAFMVASRCPVNFVISLASPFVCGKDLLKAQQEAIFEAEGILHDTNARKAMALNDALFSYICSHKSLDDIDKTDLLRLPELVGLTDEQKSGILEEVLTPWFFEFLKSDPLQFVSKVAIPVLALNGDKDLQVPAVQNLGALRNSVAGKNNFVIEEMPELNHLFQHCVTGLPSEYYDIDETIFYMTTP